MTNTPLELLQLIAPAPFGGAESVVRALAREYPGTARLAALLQHPAQNTFVEQMRDEGSEVIEISCGRRRYDREIRALRAMLQARRPDVLHTHVYHADIVGYVAARRARVPVVATVHGAPGGDRKDRFYQWLDHRVLRNFDAVIAVSEPLRSRLIAVGIPESRIHVVPNPHAGGTTLSRDNARRQLAIPADRPAIGWIGRLSHEKGVDLFIRAVSEIAPPRPLAVVVGAGPELAAAQTLVAELSLESDVHFAGERANAGSLIRAFDAVVLSSRNEGLPMVLLEAMGADVPVAAFAVGGIPDAAVPGTAWLAPAEDVTALSMAIQSVFTQHEETRRRAAAARERVHQQYSARAWAARIAEIHRAVVTRST